MGLTAINSIYQARFNRYLHNRGIKDTAQQRVWAFMGDGEMAEPESLGAIRVAAREELDNLTWVINCNLQQLDGPVHRQRQDHPGARGQLPRRRLERHQGRLGPRVGRPARQGRRRRPGQPDEHHARRPVPDLLHRGRRLRPRALLRRRPAAAQDGRAHVRLADREAAARWPRLPQGLRRVRRRHQAHRSADGDPRPHHQGLDDRRPRGQERHPPDEEADPPGPQEVPRPALPADQRPRPRGVLREDRRRAVLPPGRRLARDRVHARAPHGARRLDPAPRQPGHRAQAARRRDLRRAQAGLGQEQDRHHDGRRPPAHATG